MRCPRCRLPLRPVDVPEDGGLTIHLCDKCEGAWYPRGSLSALGQSGRGTVTRSDLVVSLVADTNTDVEPVTHCPVCAEGMNRFTFSLAPEVKIDECVEHGTWLDDGELGTILDSIAEAHSDIAAMRRARDGDGQVEPFTFTIRVLNALLSRA